MTINLDNISPYMSTDEIYEAWDLIGSYLSDIHEAVDNRLDELNYDEDAYEDGSNEEIERLLDMRDTISNTSF